MKIIEGKRPFYEIEIPEDMGRIGTQSIIRRDIGREEEKIVFLSLKGMLRELIVHLFFFYIYLLAKCTRPVLHAWNTVAGWCRSGCSLLSWSFHTSRGDGQETHGQSVCKELRPESNRLAISDCWFRMHLSEDVYLQARVEMIRNYQYQDQGRNTSDRGSSQCAQRTVERPKWVGHAPGEAECWELG